MPDSPSDSSKPAGPVRRQRAKPRPLASSPPDQAALHAAALRHLARFAATEAGLIRVLDRRILRWLRDSGAEPGAAAEAHRSARAVARDLVGAGAIDDAAFAAARVRRLTRTGRSRRAVSAHLAAKGVDPATVEASLPDPEAEFLAAVSFTRRRRFGPFHGTEAAASDAVAHQRELAALARAGFSREVAERALRLDPASAAELLGTLQRL